MAEIVITEFMDEDAVSELQSRHETHYDPTLADRQGEIGQRLGATRALIVRNRTRVDAGLLAAAPLLTCVGRLGVGLDNIDLEACRAASVAVYPATGANNLSVAEYVVTSALMLMRNAYTRNDQMLAGKWPRQAASGREISGKVLGLVGYGAIARDTAKIAAALGMDVVGHDPFLPASDPAWGSTRPMSLDGLLSVADVVSLHVPLTEATRHIIGSVELERMKRGAVLINAARGGTVDEQALADAMRHGQIAGAALDVFENEPLSGSDAPKFADLENLILTPHIAGVTVESNKRVSGLIADKVLAHLADNI